MKHSSLQLAGGSLCFNLRIVKEETAKLNHDRLSAASDDTQTSSASDEDPCTHSQRFLEECALTFLSATKAPQTNRIRNEGYERAYVHPEARRHPAGLVRH